MIDRIVVINDSSIAKGGATSLAVASAEAFSESGYAVTYLAGDDGVNENLKMAGVDIRAVGHARILSAPLPQVIFSAIYNSEAAAMIGGWIDQNDTPGTIYHLHGWAQILSPSIFAPLKRVADRLVLSAHDFFLVCPNGSFSFLKSGAICELTPLSFACLRANCDRRAYSHKLWRTMRLAVRHAIFDFRKLAPPVIAIHERMRPFLERGGISPASIRTLSNPVRAFLPDRVRAEDNREFVFIGRLENGKGPDLACAAAREARVPLRIIGDGPMESELRRLHPEVLFSGRIAASEIGKVVKRARALLMPSRYPEPYGLVATEALWSGIPLVISRTAFLAPDVVERGAGLACNPFDRREFAEALGRLRCDDKLVQSMSLAAFNDTHDLGLSFQAWIEGLFSIYEERLRSANALCA
jgi:glycosyltransferase involved in cell wall biosynthesis